MVTIKNKILISMTMMFATFCYGEGSYELRGKSSLNDAVNIEGKKKGYNPAYSLGLPRTTIFYVDIEDADNEVIDLYTSNPNEDNGRIDIAVWCPNNTPSNPESANAHDTADDTYNVRTNRSGYIGDWNDVVAVQQIATRNEKPKTFNPSNNNCGDGVYTVRFYTHATTDSRSFGNALEFMDIRVRDTQNNTLESGRVFSKHYSLIQNGFDKELNFKLYVVEGEDLGYEYSGFVWEIDSNGIQPFSFQLVSNSTGSSNESQNDKSVSTSASPTPVMEAQHNIYLNYPDKTVVAPTTQPNVTNFFYNNICADDLDPNGYDTGGYFNFYSNGSWKYKLYIDINEDGNVTLDEKVFQGNAVSGLNQVYWDGVLPDGTVISNGKDLKFNLYLSDGEVHFPWADVENRYTEVGPIITLLSATTTDSVEYYWDDTNLSATTASIDGTSVVRAWGNNLGDGALMDTWKYAYNSGLQKNVIYGGECIVPDLGGNVSGYVFDDINHNGAKDYGEAGIEGVTIVLHNITNNDCETQKTSASGAFLFDNILVSNFNLVESANETLPIAFQCPPVEEDPAGYISVDSNTKEVVFNERNASYLTFANYKGYKVAGETFIDNGLGSNLPFNGIKDGNENIFSGIKIEAKEGSTVFETQYTAGDGTFEFWVPSSKPNISLNTESKLDFKNISSNVGDTSGTKIDYNQITLSGTNESYTGVSFGYIQDPSLSLAKTETIQAGSNTLYTHKYKVNSIGNVTFSITNQTNSPVSNNSNSIIYEDQDCDGVIDVGIDNPGFTTIDVNVNSNNEVCLIIKVITQSTAPNNSTYSYSINALTYYDEIGLNILKTVTDIALITDSTTNSNLVLLKSVDKLNAIPNEVITYEIEVTNNGQEAIDTIKIDDYTPNYTNFVSASCPSVLPTGISNCQIVSNPNVGEKGNVKWEFDGILLSGENMTVLYQVRVDN